MSSSFILVPSYKNLEKTNGEQVSKRLQQEGEGRKFDRPTTNMGLHENESRNSPNAANVLAHFIRVRSLELAEFRASFDLEEHLVPSRAHNLR